ncbi:transposase [Dictyobacter formicarum]|uniref:Transposase IS4-like domain-containing protein n=1 Tax=Dictyobacter formicarum TaxID=2778368 RepID=A0ABQ3V9D0_9CHLR|nr:transposase [Dictyobacter formicarum]GHO82492.1 hypothetical protein KSZ_04980 [Dictyobacter formicarum]
MNAFDLVITQWTRQVKDLFPGLHAYQQAALAFCVQGVVLSGTAVLQKVAEAIWEYSDRETKMMSHEKRLQRFTENERIDVDGCWDRFLEQVLPHWNGKSVTLVLDVMPYTTEASIVYVGLLVYSRILPLAWCVMPQQQRWEQSQWDLVNTLFTRIHGWLKGSTCTVLADRGLSCLPLIRLCQQMGWHYVLRIKQQEWFRRKLRHAYQGWQRCHHSVKQAGQQWYGQVLLWKEHQFATTLSLCWEAGYEEPWILISDLPASHARVTDYGKRMKVEATFQDDKSRGGGIECSRFTKRDHLHRWLLVVFLATWWIAHLGSSCVRHGDRAQVDRPDRRDKGLLRIGRLWFRAILKKARQDLTPETRTRVIAQLANCLPFFHRGGRLCFSIYHQ